MLVEAVTRMAEGLADNEPAVDQAAPRRLPDLDWLRALWRDPTAQLARSRADLRSEQRAAPAEVEIDTLRDRLARALFWALLDALQAEGMRWEVASRVALRASQQAVMRAMGFEQREIAALQQVGLTTAKEDAARVRAVVASGALEAKAAQRLRRR
jgi:hypothetical protein